MDSAGQKARKRIRQFVKNKLFMEIVLPEGRKDIGECTESEIKDLKPVLI
jgi:hypothetical protein